MESVTDLFNIERYLGNGGRVMDERASLIGYFSEALERPVKQIAIRLAHYTISDLYALKSGWNDRLRTHGEISTRKWWWFVTRTKGA